MRAAVTLEHSVRRIEGPLLFLERKAAASASTRSSRCWTATDESRVGRVAALDEQTMVVEVLESALGLGVRDTRVRVWNEPLLFGVGPGMLGRTFNSLGRPTDGGGPIPAVRRMRIDGLAINPAARALPRDFIETGVSTIDLLNSLVRGQKLPLFSGAGLPHDRLATRLRCMPGCAKGRRQSSRSFSWAWECRTTPRRPSGTPWPPAPRSSTRRCSSTSRTSRRRSAC